MQSENEIAVRRENILTLCQGFLSAVGVEQAIAHSWAEIAISRDIRRDWGRGVARLISVLHRVEIGQLAPQLMISVERLTPVSARVSALARHWPDQVAQKAGSLAAQIATEQGVGVVACPKPNIVGTALWPILEAGYIGLALVQNAPLMGPPLTAEGRLLVGNNPLAIGAPSSGDRPPFLFDGSLSQHSLRNLSQRVDEDDELPADAVLALDGTVPDAEQAAAIIQALEEGDSTQGGLMPLGLGAKGLGFAMALEILAGALTGGFGAAPAEKPWGEGTLIIALSPHLFGYTTAEVADRIATFLEAFPTYPNSASDPHAPLVYPRRTLLRLDMEASRLNIDSSELL